MATEIVVTPGGDASSIYDEAFDFACLGRVTVRRASRVEPDDASCWWADLCPVGGPLLGPFEHRSRALAAEVSWLRQNWAKVVSVLAHPCVVPNHKGVLMFRGVLALAVIVVAYLVLCGIVSCDKGCSAAANPIPAPTSQVRR